MLVKFWYKKSRAKLVCKANEFLGSHGLHAFNVYARKRRIRIYFRGVEVKIIFVALAKYYSGTKLALF